MAFLHAGCRVSAICPSGHPLRFIAGLDSTYPYRALNPTGSLKSALRKAQPALLVPCDDVSVWQLHDLHARNPEFRPLIERSLGSAEVYPNLQRRGQILEAAVELGIRVPCTRAVESAEDLNEPGLAWPAVLKADGTWGGEGVAIVRNPSEAAQKLGTLLGARRTAFAWKRFLVNRHPLALWQWRRRKEWGVTLQRLIRGRQATTMFACWQGQVLASVTVEVLATQGPTGAATCVRLLRHEEIERASELLARRFMLSGFHGLDFVIEDGTEAAYLIEMNPRATQLGHLNLCPQGNLADALSARLMNKTSPSAMGTRRIQSDTIALFPRAWKTDPGNELLKTGYHDVPWEQPELVRELIRETWPERRLLSRILNISWTGRPGGYNRAGSKMNKDRSPLESSSRAKDDEPRNRDASVDATMKERRT
jgi:hypothetical protein